VQLFSNYQHPLGLLRECCFESVNRCVAVPRNDSHKKSIEVWSGLSIEALLLEALICRASIVKKKESESIQQKHQAVKLDGGGSPYIPSDSSVPSADAGFEQPLE
jgi:hypothetical protein